MNLDSALATFDKLAVNLGKRKKIWERARPYVPNGSHLGNIPEYTSLARSWDSLIPGLPPIESWTITEGLPDIDVLAQSFIDYEEIGELPRDAWAEADRPSADLSIYRHLHRPGLRHSNEMIPHTHSNT